MFNQGSATSMHITPPMKHNYGKYFPFTYDGCFCSRLNMWKTYDTNMVKSLSLLLAVLHAVSALNTSHTISSQYCKKDESMQQNISVFPGIPTVFSVPEFKGFEPVSIHMPHNISIAMQYTHKRPPEISIFGPQASNHHICLKTKNKELMLNIFLLYCPPGFVLSPNQSCICNEQDISENIKCSQVLYNSFVFVGFCVSREHEKSPLLIARCAFANHLVRPLLPIMQDNTTGVVHFCQDFNRKGKLCGECKDQYGVSVFSDTFDCIPCKGSRIGYVMKYLAVELIPTTVFFMAIFFFHIGITSGPANGFIFFAQVVSTPLEILYLTYGLKLFISGNTYLPSVLADLLTDPYCIWNLDFFRIFHSNICISTQMKVIHVLVLRYISALCPLVLLLITYAIIELQARNYRLLMFLWRVVCFPCVRWRRVWKAKSSVIDAFASCILLSYTKLVLVSFYYFSYSNVQNISGNTVGHVLSFDTSVDFLGNKHAPFLAIAIFIILTFGAFPPLILTCYQFRTFQYCLEFCRLKTQGLQQFVEAFQGCYKDGTNGKVDCRFFAGLYFIFRIVILLVMAVSTSFPSGFMMVIVSTTTFLVLFAIFRPYKKTIHNTVDALFLFLLTTVTTIQSYTYSQLQQTLKISKIFMLYYSLLYIPLIYIIAFVVTWLYKQWKRRHNQIHTPIPQDRDFFRESLLDDRSVDESETSYATPRTSYATPHVNHTEIIVPPHEDEIESDEEVKKKPCNEATCLRRQELEPILHYGTV